MRTSPMGPAFLVTAAMLAAGNGIRAERKVQTMGKKLNAQRGVVCRRPGEQFGHFGWPSVARLDNGTLAVASSGLRTAHICPFGKTVLNVSTDDGRTCSAPRVSQDSEIDDRDAGIVSLGNGRLLVSWFRSDTRRYAKGSQWAEVFKNWTDALVDERMSVPAVDGVHTRLRVASAMGICAA